MPSKKHPFSLFLEEFIPPVARKASQLNKATWLLETGGSQDAADLKAELDAEYKLLFSDSKIYNQLLVWDKDSSLYDPELKRSLNILLRTFKQYQIPQDLLEKISLKEAQLAQKYATFRPKLSGKAVSDNAIGKILKKEKDPSSRKEAWEASKEIGSHLAPDILALVKLRNLAAKSVGYAHFFTMQLDLQEVDETWLLETLAHVEEQSQDAYQKVIETIEGEQCRRFGVSREELGPWAWADPFSQEDPLESGSLDDLLSHKDLVALTKTFYEQMGFTIEPIVQRSDMFEREGKNQHAFCMNIDRGSDVRTLNNVHNSIKWLEILLHEMGHAIYELGFDAHLPWLLREPPHMITTEAMALIAGRQAYRSESLKALLAPTQQEELTLLHQAEESLRRRQLIFSRWVVVMTLFERELYRNPDQDLNQLWWSLVKKHQKIEPPKGREQSQDWAAKYHMGLAPVYYYSYLLGEIFASMIQDTLKKETGSEELNSSLGAGELLRSRLFAPGNSLHWRALIEKVTNQPLSVNAWAGQFVK